MLCFAGQLRTGRHFKKWDQRCSGLDCFKQTLVERLGKRIPRVGMHGVLQLGSWEGAAEGRLGKSCSGTASSLSPAKACLGEIQPPKSRFPEDYSLIPAKESFTRLFPIDFEDAKAGCWTRGPWQLKQQCL